MAEPKRAAADLPGSDGSEPSCLRPGQRFVRDSHGATAIEYAMIGALIFAVAAGGIRLFGSKVNTVYGQIGSAMAQVN